MTTLDRNSLNRCIALAMNACKHSRSPWTRSAVRQLNRARAALKDGKPDVARMYAGLAFRAVQLARAA